MNIYNCEGFKYIAMNGGDMIVKPVVYIDVLFTVNLLINYLLLWTTSKISKIHASFARILTGAVIGAIYAVVIFFPAFKIYYTFIAKVIFSAALIAISFNIAKPKVFLKVFGIFYVVNFTFGGAALCLFYFTNVGAFVGAVLSNGIIYFNLPWKTLIISSCAAYLIMRVTWRVLQKTLSKENMYTSILIDFDKRDVCVNALIDTGNSLHDPISDFPVIVVEFNAVKPLLPEDIQVIFSESKENDLSLISKIVYNSVWASRFRLIPFSSLGKENGMLVGFRPDKVRIMEDNGNKDLKDIIVAIYNKKLSKDNKYSALLHPEVIAQ